MEKTYSFSNDLLVGAGSLVTLYDQYREFLSLRSQMYVVIKETLLDRRQRRELIIFDPDLSRLRRMYMLSDDVQIVS